jgi:hypothetical protein
VMEVYASGFAGHPGGYFISCVSGIDPGYSCKEGRRRTPGRIPLYSY